MTKRKTKEMLELLAGQRQSGESDKAVIACNEWLRMGSGRSIAGLAEKFADAHTRSQPTTSYGTLRQWSSDFAWADRAREYDATWEQRKNAERDAIFNYGLALDYERLRKLYRLATLLEAQIYERGESGVLHNIWTPEVKIIGVGKNAEKIEFERFNAPLLEQFRKVLDDIAKEVGGRTVRQDITSDGERLIIPMIFLPEVSDE